MIAGGSGFWAETNHYPAILELKSEAFPLKVLAIYDIRNPYSETNRKNLRQILKIDEPAWINPEKFSDKEVESSLDLLHKEKKISAMIVSTDPSKHFVYSAWAAKHCISVLCDKPLVVCNNASFNIESAKKIAKQYDKLKALSLKAVKKNQHYIFCSPLRRRALAPFVKIANDLSKVYKRTGEGIRHMDVIINNGVNKFPKEFLKGGAHGYIDGIGSLAHSSYHYVDVMAWYIDSAPGEVIKLEISLPYVLRVRDYLKTEGYKGISKLISEKNGLRAKLPSTVLNSELDFMFTLKMLDKKGDLLGLVTYVSNHTTFAPRVVKYSENVLEHANKKDGGRMSHIYMDVHQGALQTWQLIKNDVVFEGNSIRIKGRKHPGLGKRNEEILYKDAYDKETVTPKDLFKSFIKYSSGIKVLSKHLNLLSSFENQNLTNKIFSAFFELLAEDYVGNKAATRSVFLETSNKRKV